MLSPDVARFRAATMRAIRSFFDAEGYLEVETPVLAPELIPEAHIEVFETRLADPYADEPAPGARTPAGRRGAAFDPAARYLVPSPEIWMKRLLARGYRDVYSLGKAFRNAESTSRVHRPEFTMLEWYGVGSDHRDQADLTARLLEHLVASLPPAAGSARVGAPMERLTVAEGFERYAGVRPDFARTDAMREAARRLGVHIGPDETEEDLFQRLLVTFVEPALPGDHPVLLTDYPALVPTLARRDGPVAERWELYLSGMEIANCYHEETDREVLERFLDREARRKRDALVPHPPARSLLEFAGAPSCSGVALGMDRLIMALLEIRDIGGVIFFG
ncbi:MAG: amino acid--tRNA ligase-related protein [Spirochaetota bacterium]